MSHVAQVKFHHFLKCTSIFINNLKLLKISQQMRYHFISQVPWNCKISLQLCYTITLIKLNSNSARNCHNESRTHLDGSDEVGGAVGHVLG